ncbi:MAG: oxaloacetate decarboxylase [Lachnotalea sp.]
MNRSVKALLTILGTVSIIGLIISYIVYSKRNSFTIIGGSDGPTSIFIAGKIGNSEIGYIILGLFLIVLVICSILLFKNKK